MKQQRQRNSGLYDFPYQAIGLGSFYGGWSVDNQLASSSQFYNSRHIDFRKAPSQFSVLPGTSLLSNTSDLPLAITQVPSGVKYLVGDAGYVYKINNSNILSPTGNLTEAGAAGIVYRSDTDHVYMTGASGIGRLKFVSTSPSFEATWFMRGRTTTSTCYKTGGTNTYTVPITSAEVATSLRTFVSDIEPIYSIKVLIASKGTGDWTMTLHDDANNVLATKTITNANLVSNQLNEFTFSTPVRIYVSPNGRTYHFHLTSTVADGTVNTTTASSLADCDMELTANALVSTNNGLHPMINFLQYTLIGNGRYVAQYEPLQDSPTTSDFSRHRITLPSGFEVCGFAQKNLMVVIGAEKRSTSGEFQEGAIFLWDGISQTYNDWYPIPEGSPESLFSHKNVVTFWAGGALYRIRGTDEPRKIRTARNTDSEFSNIADTTHVYPNMSTVRRGILLLGYPSTTTNQSLDHSVYSLGSVSREYPESFGLNYNISTSTYLNNGTNNLKLGLVKNFGDTLLISWRDDGQSAGKRYGVDIVNNSSVPASDFLIESLYYDLGLPYKQKYADKVIATFSALPSGTQLRLKYRLDGATDWTYGDYVTSGATYAKLSISKPFIGIEFGMEASGYTSTPVVQSLQALVTVDGSEREIG